MPELPESSRLDAPVRFDSPKAGAVRHGTGVRNPSGSRPARATKLRAQIVPLCV